MTEVKATNPNRPPDWLFRYIVNPMMKTILRSPLHRILSNGLATVTFTGRKSGTVFTTPVAYHWLDENTVMFMTRSPWWRNFQNGEPIELHIKGRTYTVTPQLILDQDEVWGYVSQFLERYDGNTRRVGIMVGDDATETEIRTQAADFVAVKATLR